MFEASQQEQLFKSHLNWGRHQLSELATLRSGHYLLETGEQTTRIKTEIGQWLKT